MTLRCEPETWRARIANAQRHRARVAFSGAGPGNDTDPTQLHRLLYVINVLETHLTMIADSDSFSLTGLDINDQAYDPVMHIGHSEMAWRDETSWKVDELYANRAAEYYVAYVCKHNKILKEEYRSVPGWASTNDEYFTKVNGIEYFTARIEQSLQAQIDAGLTPDVEKQVRGAMVTIVAWGRGGLFDWPRYLAYALEGGAPLSKDRETYSVNVAVAFFVELLRRGDPTVQQPFPWTKLAYENRLSYLAVTLNSRTPSMLFIDFVLDTLEAPLDVVYDFPELRYRRENWKFIEHIIQQGWSLFSTDFFRRRDATVPTEAFNYDYDQSTISFPSRGQRDYDIVLESYIGELKKQLDAGVYPRKFIDVLLRAIAAQQATIVSLLADRRLLRQRRQYIPSANGGRDPFPSNARIVPIRASNANSDVGQFSETFFRGFVREETADVTGYTTPVARFMESLVNCDPSTADGQSMYTSVLSALDVRSMTKSDMNYFFEILVRVVHNPQIFAAVLDANETIHLGQRFAYAGESYERNIMSTLQLQLVRFPADNVHADMFAIGLDRGNRINASSNKPLFSHGYGLVTAYIIADTRLFAMYNKQFYLNDTVVFAKKYINDICQYDTTRPGAEVRIPSLLMLYFHYPSGRKNVRRTRLIMLRSLRALTFEHTWLGVIYVYWTLEEELFSWVVSSIDIGRQFGVKTKLVPFNSEITAYLTTKLRPFDDKEWTDLLLGEWTNLLLLLIISIDFWPSSIAPDKRDVTKRYTMLRTIASHVNDIPDEEKSFFVDFLPNDARENIRAAFGTRKRKELSNAMRSLAIAPSENR